MNNRWIAIGDIHGRNTWKSIVNLELDNVDKIIFIGDYFDSFDISPLEQINNFKDILEFKKSYPDKVILLIGNHDYHYISTVGEHYSGYNSLYSNIIEYEFMNYAFSKIDKPLLQLCYESGKYLFSHAGFTKTWLRKVCITSNIEKNVNELFYYQPNRFKFDHNSGDFYGDDITHSPIWVRPKSLLKDKIEGYIQIVGHTANETIIHNNNVYFIDALENGYYLYCEKDNIIIKQI